MLDGRYARLEPIGPQHVADLYRAASTGDAKQRFTYLFDAAAASRGGHGGLCHQGGGQPTTR